MLLETSEKLEDMAEKEEAEMLKLQERYQKKCEPLLATRDAALRQMEGYWSQAVSIARPHRPQGRREA